MESDLDVLCYKIDSNRCCIWSCKIHSRLFRESRWPKKASERRLLSRFPVWLRTHAAGCRVVLAVPRRESPTRRLPFPALHTHVPHHAALPLRAPQKITPWHYASLSHPPSAGALPCIVRTRSPSLLVRRRQSLFQPATFDFDRLGDSSKC